MTMMTSQELTLSCVHIDWVQRVNRVGMRVIGFDVANTSVNSSNVNAVRMKIVPNASPHLQIDHACHAA